MTLVLHQMPTWYVMKASTKWLTQNLVFESALYTTKLSEPTKTLNSVGLFSFTLGQDAGAATLSQIWHFSDLAASTMSTVKPAMAIIRAKRWFEGWHKFPWSLAMTFLEARLTRSPGPSKEM